MEALVSKVILFLIFCVALVALVNGLKKLFKLVTTAKSPCCEKTGEKECCCKK